VEFSFLEREREREIEQRVRENVKRCVDKESASFCSSWRWRLNVKHHEKPKGKRMDENRNNNSMS